MQPWHQIKLCRPLHSSYGHALTANAMTGLPLRLSAAAACLLHAVTALAPIPFELAGRGEAGAVHDLVARSVSPVAAAALQLSVSPKLCHGLRLPPATRGRLCFRIFAASVGGLVRIEGSSAVDLARGVGTYFREYHNCSFSWKRTGGFQSALALPPSQWPAIQGRTEVRRSNISYYQNVVASSYTHAFWKFEDWQHFIDWMALSGINIALAYTGQELLYQKTFAKFGVNTSQFGNWSNGVAWLGWSRGQSMHGVGTSAEKPLSQTWMQKQWALQKQILARMRQLGIVPVLPAFQGNVPPVMKTELFPSANISVQGSGRHYAAWLDATDPLFQQIGDE